MEKKIELDLVNHSSPLDIYGMFKRMLDTVLSFLAILVLSPMFIIVALIIKIESNGCVFYKQERVKRNGESFFIYKFRTMKVDNRDLKDILTPQQYIEFKKNFKLEHDPRVTKFGRFLRKFSLDELPQLINIIKGDMSLIGPRPITRSELAFYANKAYALLSVRPGLTGYWQAYARNKSNYENGERQNMELYYVYHHSFCLDIRILIKTVGAVISGSGK